MLHYKNETLLTRTMNESDIDYFASKFIELNWGDRKSTLLSYYHEQNTSVRDVLVAEYKGVPAGYVTLVPNAKQGPFADKYLPEIKDLNVLPPYRRLGIGNHLMDCIEAVAKSKADQVTLGVGLYADYGTAQRMYVKRGYIPDGSGLWQGDRNLAPYESCVNSDDLNLFFVKELVVSN